MHRQPFKEFLEKEMIWHQTSRYYGQSKGEHEYENHKALVLDFTGAKNFMSNDWNFLAVGSSQR